MEQTQQLFCTLIFVVSMHTLCLIVYNTNAANSITSTTQQISPQLSDYFQLEMLARKNRIKKICENAENYMDTRWIQDTTTLTKLLILKPENILWCPVFKAGSTPMLQIFLDLVKSKQKV
jgi:hypothetical protein